MCIGVYGLRVGVHPLQLQQSMRLQQFRLMMRMQDSSQFVCCQDQVQEPTLEAHHSESLGCILKNAITNIAYNLKHSNYINIPGLLREVITLNQNDGVAYLLGRQYSYQSKEQFNSHFQNTLWFSYRKNIPGIGDDRGWGCMIRSVMMMIAQALKRATHLTSYEVLNHFKDKGSFSFSSICKAGEIDKRWTTSSEVVAVCQQMARSHQDLQLNIVNIPFSCLITSNLEEELVKRPHKNTLIVLHTKLGMETIDENFLPHLKQLMKLPYFCGLLGGIPGKAMYILGFKDDKIICLDPHYVQDDKKSQQSYFKQHPRGLGFNELSSCISISFLVHDFGEYRELIRELYRLEKQYKDSRAITLMLTPELKSSLEEEYQKDTKKARKFSTEDFELIQ